MRDQETPNPSRKTTSPPSRTTARSAHNTPRLGWIFLLGALLLVCVNANDDNVTTTVLVPDCSDVSKTSHRLECWLWQLQVAIPQQSFKKGFVSVDIHDMVCTNFGIGSIESDYSNVQELHANVSGISATCTGKYHSTGGLSGNVEASVASEDEDDKQGLVVTLQVTTGSTNSTYGIPMPLAVHTTDCTTSLKVPRHGIHFSGSISAKVIDWFSLSIAHWITEALDGQVCPLVQQQLDPKLSQYLQQADAWLEQYLPKNGTMSETVDSREEPYQLAQTSMQRERRQSELLLADSEDVIQPRSLSSTRNTTDPSQYPVVHSLLVFGNTLLRKYLNTPFLGSWFPAPCDQAQCADFFLGIAGIVRKYTGGIIRFETPRLFRNLTWELPYGATLSLSIHHLELQGLDQLDSLELLVPSDILTSSFNSTGWNVSALMHLRVDTLPGQSAFHSEPLEESFRLLLNVSNIHAMATTLLESHKWDQLSMYQVVEALQDIALGNNRTQNVKCLVSSIKGLIVPEVLADVLVSSVSIVPSDGSAASLEVDLDGLVNTVIDLVLSEYPVLVSSVVQGLVNGPGKQALNSFLEQILHDYSDEEACIAKPDPGTHPHWVNFTKVKFLYKVNNFLNHQHTLTTMNQFLDCITRVLMRHEAVGDDFKLLEDQDGQGLDVKVREFDISHFDSLKEVKLLHPSPSDPTSLETSVSWGTLDTPQAVVSLEVSYPAFGLHAVINATAFLSNIQAEVATRVDYNLNQLVNITVADVLEQGQCAMVPASEVRLDPSTHLSIGSIGVNLSAVVAGGNGDPIQINTSTDRYPAVQDMILFTVNWAMGLAREVANKATERLVVEASGICEGELPKEEEPTSSKKWPAVAWMCGILFVLGQAGMLLIKSKEEGEGDGYDEHWSAHDATQALLSEHIPMEEQYEEMFDHASQDQKTMDQQLLDDIIDDLNNEMNEPLLDEQHQTQRLPLNALIQDTKVPEWIRHVVPIVIVGIIFLLLSSNLSTGASVDLVISIGGEKHMKLPALFAFSLGNTVREMYSAGIYPLLFLVVVFSGIWPYAKLLLMFYAWALPPRNAHRRESLLLALDALGKFSLVDTYVLVVMIVAFRYHLDLEDAALDVYVSPQYGFYGFLGATSLSLVVGHLMLFFHRRSQTPLMSTTLTRESLFDHEFDVQENGPRRPLSRLFQLFLFSCSLVASAFLALGFSKKSFTFEFGGLAGMALGESRSTSYSLLSLGTSLYDSVEKPTHIIFLQLAYYFYAVVTPLACLLLLMALLIWPMTLSRQRTILAAAEIANAWSAVEVFVLSIIAALLQISTFASFIIGDRCDIINELLEEYFGDAIEGDSVCYTVKAYVASDCWYLVAGVIMNSFVVSLVLRFAHCAMEERIERSHCEAEGLLQSSAMVPGGSNLEISMAKFIYRLPIRCIIFGNAASFFVVEEEPAAENEEEEEILPDWRHWF